MFGISAHPNGPSVMEGEIVLATVEEEFSIKNGDHFILPYDMGSFTIQGAVKLIVSHP